MTVTIRKKEEIFTQSHRGTECQWPAFIRAFPGCARFFSVSLWLCVKTFLPSYWSATRSVVA
jgi:hypothetical protein